MKNKKDREGFRVKCWDGSVWIIPYEACLSAYAKNMGANWSKDDAIEYMRKADSVKAQFVFQETNWSDFEKNAIRIQEPSDLNMDAMWETAEITNEPC
jgi:hypothetical protein